MNGDPHTPYRPPGRPPGQFSQDELEARYWRSEAERLTRFVRIQAEVMAEQQRKLAEAQEMVEMLERLRDDIMHTYRGRLD